VLCSYSQISCITLLTNLFHTDYYYSQLSCITLLTNLFHTDYSQLSCITLLTNLFHTDYYYSQLSCITLITNVYYTDFSLSNNQAASRHYWRVLATPAQSTWAATKQACC